MLALEDILLAVVVLSFGGWFIVRPLLRLVATAKRDPVVEAKERLRVAQMDAEAAKLNQQADEILDHLYDETLNSHDIRKNR